MRGGDSAVCALAAGMLAIRAAAAIVLAKRPRYEIRFVITMLRV
jgi:hypothetical protein